MKDRMKVSEHNLLKVVVIIIILSLLSCVKAEVVTHYYPPEGDYPYPVEMVSMPQGCTGTEKLELSIHSRERLFATQGRFIRGGVIARGVWEEFSGGVQSVRSEGERVRIAEVRNWRVLLVRDSVKSWLGFQKKCYFTGMDRGSSDSVYILRATQ